MVEDYDSCIPEKYDIAWNKFFDDSSSVNCLVAIVDSKIVGFMNYLLHESAWDEEPFCYLSDLYVKPEYRLNGYARYMIQALLERTIQYGWARLYWVTEFGNPTRILYDRLANSEFVRYHIDVPNCIKFNEGSDVVVT